MISLRNLGCRNIVEKKWSYWDSYWSYVEWVIIITSLSAVGFYCYKECI